MVDTLVIAATGPLIETDHILGVIVRNSQQVAEFPLAGLFVTHLESGLHINAGIAVESDKVDLFFTLLANKDFRIEGVEMKINGIDHPGPDSGSAALSAEEAGHVHHYHHPRPGRHRGDGR